MHATLDKSQTTEDQALLFELERQFERKRVIKGVALFVSVAVVSFIAMQSFQYVWLLITNCC